LNKDTFYLEEWAEVRIETLNKSTFYSALMSSDTTVEEVMNEADNIRLQFTKEAIEPLHLLAAICTPGVCFSYEQLKTFPLKREELIVAVTETEKWQSLISSAGHASNGQTESKGSLAILKYCTDKTLQAKEGKSDTIVGRDQEIRTMAEIFCRRSKPNVLIIGEPGVGKSALVDGFAHAINNHHIPNALAQARIFELNTGSLIAGASYKGEIEDRLKSLFAEIKQYEKAILFIDEIHTLVDKNSAAAGAIGLLKPELARGEITLIGATTLDEYRKTIQTDEAFSRRFEVLVVEEPNPNICFQMVRAAVPSYEKHHDVSVADEAIWETIRLAKRYIKDRRLPDAALDLIDRAMAALQMINDTGGRDLASLQKEFEEKKAAHTAAAIDLEEWQWLLFQMKQKISPILWASVEAEEDPASLTNTDSLIAYIEQALVQLLPATIQPRHHLDKSDVTAIVSYKTGIPMGKVRTQERERLLTMEVALKQRVIGQDKAVRTLSDAILESRSGLNKAGQPIGSFFFLGPTGTGKTELTKALAEFLFQEETSIIRFDMSEFKEEHAAALLYGAPPGYVGYQEGGLLVNKIRQKPYSVVLFDEIEKAHPSVFDVFLQIMDEGKLHDKLGKEGDFSNAVIIFTSNIGSQYVEEAFKNGAIPTSTKLMEIMGAYFRPEFLGRLTEIVPFASMTEEMVLRILHIQLKGLIQTLEKKGITLALSDAACRALAQWGYTPKYGARPLNGVIRMHLRRPLSKKLISGEIDTGSYIYLDVDENNELRWHIDKK
jgi:ATP-dependent Clp protease ATP-binding subunit ClpA